MELLLSPPTCQILTHHPPPPPLPKPCQSNCHSYAFIIHKHPLQKQDSSPELAVSTNKKYKEVCACCSAVAGAPSALFLLGGYSPSPFDVSFINFYMSRCHFPLTPLTSDHDKTSHSTLARFSPSNIHDCKRMFTKQSSGNI